MIGAEATVETDKDASGAVRDGVEDALFEAADKGFAVSKRQVPHGATNTLDASGFEPTKDRDGSIIWGYRAEYAEDVERGTRPHWVPIEPLKLWARRVLGEERAAFFVQRKIAEEGTDPQPFVEPGVQAMKFHLWTKGIADSVRTHL